MFTVKRNQVVVTALAVMIAAVPEFSGNQIRRRHQNSHGTDGRRGYGGADGG